MLIKSHTLIRDILKSLNCEGLKYVTYMSIDLDPKDVVKINIQTVADENVRELLKDKLNSK